MKQNKRNKRNAAIILAACILIAGAILLLSAAAIGENAAGAAIRANGGSMDTSQYLLIMETAMRSAQLAGTALILIGGFAGTGFLRDQINDQAE